MLFRIPKFAMIFAMISKNSWMLIGADGNVFRNSRIKELRNQRIDIIVIPDNDRESENYGIKDFSL